MRKFVLNVNNPNIRATQRSHDSRDNCSEPRNRTGGTLICKEWHVVDEQVPRDTPCEQRRFRSEMTGSDVRR